MTDDRQKTIVTVVLNLPEGHANTLPAQRVHFDEAQSMIVDLWIREEAGIIPRRRPSKEKGE